MLLGGLPADESSPSGPATTAERRHSQGCRQSLRGFAPYACSVGAQSRSVIGFVGRLRDRSAGEDTAGTLDCTLPPPLVTVSGVHSTTFGRVASGGHATSESLP